jgi:hypothetical protein
MMVDFKKGPTFSLMSKHNFPAKDAISDFISGFKSYAALAIIEQTSDSLGMK